MATATETECPVVTDFNFATPCSLVIEGEVLDVVYFDQLLGGAHTLKQNTQIKIHNWILVKKTTQIETQSWITAQLLS